MPVAAFLGALAAVALVYRLSLVAGRRLDPRVLLLAGVVVGSFAGALMSAILVLSARRRHPQRLPLAARRVRRGVLAGSRHLRSVRRPSARCCSLLTRAPLDLLVLGEEPAHHLGAAVERTRRTVYLCTALLTAASVATCGIIGFVGLVVPHAVRDGGPPAPPNPAARGLPRRWRASWCSPTSSRGPRCGPLELPVGVVTALVGVPVFALAAPADAHVILEAREVAVRYRGRVAAGAGST